MNSETCAHTLSLSFEAPPSEGKTKRARTRGTDTQATRKACAQPALEMWQQYTPAPTNHPAIVHQAMIEPANDADFSAQTKN